MQIQTCVLSPTAPTTYQVPPGAIMLFNKTSPTSCPTISPDWLAYTPAVGYALVGLPTSAPAPYFAMTQGTALTESATDFTAHTCVFLKIYIRISQLTPHQGILSAQDRLLLFQIL